MKFPIYGKIRNVPNHQPGIYCIILWKKVCVSNQWLVISSHLKNNGAAAVVDDWGWSPQSLKNRPSPIKAFRGFMWRCLKPAEAPQKSEPHLPHLVVTLCFIFPPFGISLYIIFSVLVGSILSIYPFYHILKDHISIFSWSTSPTPSAFPQLIRSRTQQNLRHVPPAELCPARTCCCPPGESARYFSMVSLGKQNMKQ